MKVIMGDSSTTLIREKGDRIYTESALFYALKRKLLERGSDVVKKLMCKDGHLVSEGIYYIRERKGGFCIWDPNHQLRDAAKEFNREGEVTLIIER